MRCRHLSNLFFLGILTFVLFQPNILLAQDAEKEKEQLKVDALIDQLRKEKADTSATHELTWKEKNEKKTREGKPVITPYIAPAYSPELSLSLSGGALVTFTTDRNDTSLLRSTVPIAATVSINGSYLLTSYWTTYFLSNRLVLNGIFQFRNIADHYYGVGLENGLNADFPDSTNYTRRYWQIYGKPMWKISKTMYLGFVADLNYTLAKDVNAHMAQDPYFIQDGPHNRNSGVGFAVSYDTRDFQQNAYKGALLSLTVSSYGFFLGGDNRYQAVEIEYRKFFPLSNKKEGRILAFDIRARHTYNDVPYPELSYVGSSNDIRGYRSGRFRDRISNVFVAEYRHKFYGKSFFGSRSGFVVWTGIGCIGSIEGESFFVDNLPNFGVGYRFEVENRMNVRIDIGFGRESSGVYFNFLEAY